MKSITALTNITGNYLKVGNSPRFFVHVATSERKWATVAANTYTNRIQRVQSITDQIDSFGGMGTVSAANVDVLKLGEEIKFYSSASLFPKYQGMDVGAGRIYDRSSVYATARGNTVGDVCSFTSINVGQSFITPLYTVYRGFVQFDLSVVSPTITSCEEAYLGLTGLADASDTDFSIYVVLGEWATGSIGVGSYDEFAGWETGTADYTGTILNETFSTSVHFSTSATNRIRLNRAGRTEVVNAAAGTLKLMLLSSRDYGYDATPTDNEYVRFQISESSSTPSLDLIYNTVKPDNERARIYLCYNDATSGIPTSVSLMLNMWSGVVDGWSLDQKTLSLDMRHDDFKRNTKLTSDAIKREDTGYTYCPDENIGKTRPIVIGDFTGNIKHGRSFGAFIEETGSNRWGYGDHVKAYVYDESVHQDRKLIISSAELKTIGTYIGMYDTSVESVVPIPGTVTTTGIGKVILSLGSTNDFPYSLTVNNTTEYQLLNPIITVVPGYALLTSAPDLLNPMYAIDWNSTNYSSIIGNDTLGAGYYTDIGFGGDVYNAAVVFETSAPYGYSTCGAYAAINWTKKNGTAGAQDYWIYVDGQHVKDLVGGVDFQRSVYITMVGSAYYSTSKPLNYRNLGIYSGYNTQFPTEAYIRCQGIPDDGSGTYTGTASKLIENPSDVIRWFAMVKGGYTAGEIDSSFTTARTDLSGWEFAFQWNDDSGIENLFNFEGQKGIVDELASQCNSIVWEDHTGKLKMRVFDATDTFPNSATNIPADLDRFEYEGSPSSGSLTRHPIFGFKLDRMTIDETYNDFVLKYKRNYATNEYDSVLTFGNGLGVSASVSHNITSSSLRLTSPWFDTAAKALTELKDLTSACYNDINTTNTLVFEAWAIRDEATATLLLQRLIEWHSRRRFKITLTTGLNALAFELGDFINVRTDDIEDQFGTAFMNCKKWKITKLTTDLTACKIEIEAVEAEIY